MALLWGAQPGSCSDGRLSERMVLKVLAPSAVEDGHIWVWSSRPAVCGMVSFMAASLPRGRRGISYVNTLCVAGVFLCMCSNRVA